MATGEFISKSKLRKLAKKSGRRRNKTKELLRKSGNISISPNPTKHLLVSNGGLGNSVSRDEIVGLFRPYGLLEAVIMPEQMPHSFVTFADVESATKALEVVNGHRLGHGEPCEQVVTLYVSYVDKVPQMAPIADQSPEGLQVIHGFIDEGTETELQELIKWSDADSQSCLKHRRVKHYGYEFDYGTNNVDKDRPLQEPMPGLLTDIIGRIMETGHVTCRPDQVAVNQYLPGQGIPPHVDTHSAFEDAIVSLSIGSMVSMDFTHPDGTHVAAVLPPRSLLVMTGEARYLWSHGITPRKNDIIPDTTSEVGGGGMTLSPRGIRTSFTFRAVRGRPCICDFPERCDSQRRTNPLQRAQAKPQADPEVKKPSSEAEAIRLERSQVHRVYNEIAPHFSDTRYKPWPQVASFLNGLEKGSVVLDVGCGNGKYIGVNPDIHMIGCDRSSELISICAGRGHEVFVCDGLEVSVKPDTFDACISIAVIHHFSTRSRRLEALKELARLLRPGGLALIYVWAMEQKKQNQKSKYLMKRNGCADGESTSEVRVDGAGKGESDGSGPDMTREENGGDVDLGERLEQINLREDGGEDGSHVQCTTEKKEVDSCDGRSHSDNNVGRTAGSSHCKRTAGTLDDSEQTVLDSGGEVVIPVSNCSRPTETDEKLDKCIDGINGGQDPGMTDNGTRSYIGCSTGVASDNSVEPSRCVGSSEEPSTGSTSHLSVHINKTEFKDQDLLVPWHLKSTQKQGPADSRGSVYYRFYHVFQEGELETLVREVGGGVSIQKSYYDQGNWCVIFRKNCITEVSV